MKKLLCLALCALLCLAACAALADVEYADGIYRYTVNETTGEATLLGITANYAHVKVPDTLGGYLVTAVAPDAFNGNQRLTSIVLPASVALVGDRAFAGCTELETVQMDGVTTLGESAFEGSTLRKAVLPETLTTVGERAFAECQRLYSVSIPASLTVIPDEMFTGCRFLKNVKLAEGITTIGGRAFCTCYALEEFVLPASVTEVGVNPLNGCTGLTKLSVAEGSTTFKTENGALIRVADACLVSYAAGLKARSFTVPEDVAVIGPAAFTQSHNLKEIIVPGTVTQVCDYAFWYCTGLKTVTVAEGVSVHPTAFAECYALVMQ